MAGVLKGDMSAKSLSQVGMTVKSLNESIEFYWGTFGIPVIKVFDMPAFVIENLYGIKNAQVRMALLRCGWGSFIELFEFTPTDKTVDAKYNRPGLTHIALDVGNVKRVYKKLKTKGVEFITEPMREGKTEYIFLKDPDGHLVELIDMGFLYYANKFFGRIVGWINMMTKFRDLNKI